MDASIVCFTILLWIYNFAGSIFLGEQTLSPSYARKHHCLMLYAMVQLPPVLQFVLFANWFRRKTNVYNTLGQIGNYLLLFVVVIQKILNTRNDIVVSTHQYGILAIFLATTVALIMDAVVFIIRNGDY